MNKLFPSNINESLMHGEKPTKFVFQLGRISNDLDFWYGIQLTNQQLREILDTDPALREECFIDFNTSTREKLFELISRQNEQE